MDLIDQLKVLSSKASKQMDLIKTEEATKNAFVMPFISALGYNVFDPTEVTPELTADIGTKKKEKVDYAILKEGEPIILFECKWCGSDLNEENFSQLYRYFNVTKARFGVLTNGILYRFYSDLDEPNKMDTKPFLEINLLEVKDSVVDELKQFSKSFFNVQEALTTATELKYTREIKRILTEQLSMPSEEFVKFFASQIYTGKLNQAAKQQFTHFTKKALNQFINDRINDRLKSALVAEEQHVETNDGETQEENDKSTQGKIVTTEEEIEGYEIVRSILEKAIDGNRVVMRDKVNFCGILLDDNNRKPICRFYFNNPKKKYLALINEDKQEEKVPIKELKDIHQYAEKLKATVSYYDNSTKKTS